MNLNFSTDHAWIDRQIFINGVPMGKFASFLFGVFAAAFVLLPLACAFWYAVLTAALQEADMRAAKNAVIGISQSDRNCIEWRQDDDSAWRCVKR